MEQCGVPPFDQGLYQQGCSAEADPYPANQSPRIRGAVNIAVYRSSSHFVVDCIKDRRKLTVARKIVLVLVAIMAVAIFSLARAAGDRTFQGQIMDAMCAANGSHSPGGYQATHTNNPKDCTLACVKAGSKFVLYNTAQKTTLQLDDQDKARDFAGQDVTVTGSYNNSDKTIHVQNIKASS